MRKLLGVVAGVVVAVAAVLILELIGHTVNASARAGTVEAMNAPARLFVATGWFLGPFAGALAALRVGRWPPAAWIVGALMLAGGVANFVTIPHPLWMQVAAVLLPIAAVLAALRPDQRRARVHRSAGRGAPA